ncbi:MAG: 4-coumarate--CoA ligase family protein [Proteobacteria bacterium]|nr:4-coumarate--CoA ligase family protein [Pseudomonadota bacterium]MDA1330968.1 4-coumarate--CoA ligase family protein [Pseudomonadota bacterium]
MIFRSPHADVSAPRINVADFVLGDISAHENKTAIIQAETSRKISYRELSESIYRLAAGLQAGGFKKGDVLAIYSPNVPEYVVIFLAVLKLGGICTTVNPLYTADELAKQLIDAKAKLIVTVPDFLDKAETAIQKHQVDELIVIGEARGYRRLEELMQSGIAVIAPEISAENDVCALPYSSGTTGLPKGVMLTHYNLIMNMRQAEGMTSHNAIGEQDTVLGVLPFFHIYGMVVIMLYSLYRRGTIVCMSRFDMEVFLAAIETYKVTITPIVPPIVLGLAKHPAVERYDLSSLKLILSGAAPLGAGVAMEAAARVRCNILQGYGMTEASPVTHLLPNQGTAKKIGSIGLPVPNTEVMIVDPQTRESLSNNQNGEIWIRGPQIMKGYLNRPEATAESITKEGWYRTGDIGYVDDEGFFYAVDRIKELIKYKGMQVAPAELEALLLTHPAVSDAAVIPVADEEAGELPKAVVVIKKGLSVSAEEIMGFVSQRVAPHKKIRIVEFVEQIPKSASGKILRRVLIQKEREKN